MLNEKIVYYRKKNMLTQEELAYQLNVSDKQLQNGKQELFILILSI